VKNNNSKKEFIFMAEKKEAKPKQAKTEKTPKKAVAVEGEKIYTIPLREAYKKSERKRSPYAMRAIREYLLLHTRANEVKLGEKLNEAVWARGIKKPARSVRVHVIKDGGVAKAELVGYEFRDFKAAPKTEKKGAREKLMDRLGPKAAQKEKEDKLAEGKAKPEAAKPMESHEVGESA
jgi:large subunit ribosomal protein L31e